MKSYTNPIQFNTYTKSQTNNFEELGNFVLIPKFIFYLFIFHTTTAKNIQQNFKGVIYTIYIMLLTNGW